MIETLGEHRSNSARLSFDALVDYSSLLEDDVQVMARVRLWHRSAIDRLLAQERTLNPDENDLYSICLILLSLGASQRFPTLLRIDNGYPGAGEPLIFVNGHAPMGMQRPERVDMKNLFKAFELGFLINSPRFSYHQEDLWWHVIEKDINAPTVDKHAGLRQRFEKKPEAVTIGHMKAYFGSEADLFQDCPQIIELRLEG